MIVPAVIQNGLLKELHYAHTSVAKMKNLARSYYWWPKLDTDIEQFFKGCTLCMELRPNPQLARLIK